MTNYDEIKDRIDAMLKDRFYEFNIYPTGQTKRNDNWDCDSWRVVITGPEKRRMATQYYTGLGHRKSKKPMPVYIAKLGPRIMARVDWEKENLKPVQPRAADVLYSLFLDGEAINQSFTDWAGDFGYNTDSIKHRNLYDECCKTGEELRKLFSHDLRSMLQELTQDL